MQAAIHHLSPSWPTHAFSTGKGLLCGVAWCEIHICVLERRGQWVTELLRLTESIEPNHAICFGHVQAPPALVPGMLSSP